MGCLKNRTKYMACDISAMIPKTRRTNKVALPLPADCLEGSTRGKLGRLPEFRRSVTPTASGKSFEVQLNAMRSPSRVFFLDQPYQSKTKALDLANVLSVNTCLLSTFYFRFYFHLTFCTCIYELISYCLISM